MEKSTKNETRNRFVIFPSSSSACLIAIWWFYTLEMGEVSCDFCSIWKLCIRWNVNKSEMDSSVHRVVFAFGSHLTPNKTYGSGCLSLRTHCQISQNEERKTDWMFESVSLRLSFARERLQFQVYYFLRLGSSFFFNQHIYSFHFVQEHTNKLNPSPAPALHNHSVSHAYNHKRNRITKNIWFGQIIPNFTLQMITGNVESVQARIFKQIRLPRNRTTTSSYM